MASVTKRALAVSFKKLLGTRPLSKITVKDIVEDAEVNRQTFYYHFHDIYDLIRWIFEEDAHKILALEDGTHDWRAHFLSILLAMQRERSLVMNAFHSLSRELLEQYLYNVIFALVCDKLEANCDSLSVSDADKRFIADFYKYAFVGVLLTWIRSGMRGDPEALVDKLMRMLDGELRRCLEKFSV